MISHVKKQMHLIDKKVNLSEHKADRQTSKEMTFSLTAHTTKLLKESRFPFLLLNKQMDWGFFHTSSLLILIMNLVQTNNL